MKKRAVLTTEEAMVKSSSPILLIDKVGEIGNYLVRELVKDFLVVYASSEKPIQKSRIVHIPYRKKKLQIPNNNFSHIFLIVGDDGEGRELFPSLLKKSQDTRARLIIIISSSADIMLIRQIEQLSTVAPLTLFITGDIYGTGSGKIDKFLKDARELGKITLLNDGLGNSYPVYIEDVVIEVINTTFQSNNLTQTFLLFQKFPLTDLAIARLILILFPETKVFFKKNKILNSTPYSPKEGTFIKDDATLLEKIKKLEADYIKPEKKKKVLKKNSKIKKIIILSIIGVILLPFVTTLLFSGFASFMLKSGGDDTRHLRLATAEKKFTISKNTFLLAEETAQSLGKILGLVGLEAAGKNITSTLRTGRQLARIGEMVIAAAQSYQEVITGKSTNPVLESQEGTQNLRAALTLVQELKTEDSLPPQIKQALNKNNESLAILNTFSELMPDILGIPGEKKYLILFQNNMELRPGGGFIGSYAVIKFKNGKIGNLAINDIYDADGKLKGHVEPPFALRKYAGIKHWYLRDSNFSVDSQENAEKAVYFLELETGERVDGVIAIDTEVLKSLLKIYGPLKISHYDQTVTSENIVDLTQGESQDNFFPGSTQKKDFLNALKIELLKKIQTSPVSFDTLTKELKELIDGKHATFILDDKTQQKILSQAKISGNLDVEKEDNNTASDFLLISEANIGGTKGNKYLKKEVVQNVRFAKDGEIQDEVKIHYNNTSFRTTKFAGDYLGFLQLVLPGNAVLTSIKINDIDFPIIPAITDPQVYEGRNFKQQQGIEVTSEKIVNKNVFGFSFSVPADTKKEITISYTMRAKEEVVNSFKLTSVKEQGAQNDPYLLRIYYPEGKKPTELSNLTDKLSWAEYKGVLSKNISFEITFDK